MEKRLTVSICLHLRDEYGHMWRVTGGQGIAPTEEDHPEKLSCSAVSVLLVGSKLSAPGEAGEPFAWVSEARRWEPGLRWPPRSILTRILGFTMYGICLLVPE